MLIANLFAASNANASTLTRTLVIFNFPLTTSMTFIIKKCMKENKSKSKKIKTTNNKVSPATKVLCETTATRDMKLKRTCMTQVSKQAVPSHSSGSTIRFALFSALSHSLFAAYLSTTLLLTFSCWGVFLIWAQCTIQPTHSGDTSSLLLC